MPQKIKQQLNKPSVGIIILAMFAILCITGLELFALSQGIDGKLFAGSVALIGVIVAGIAGYKIGGARTIKALKAFTEDKE